MQLVVVESPTKAKTIGKFLGKEYTIKASMGHIMDLPKSKLGVDVEHDFTPLFEVVADKAKIIAELKAAAKGATSIILATDPDREGEAIASHVKDVLSSSSKGKVQSSKFTRVVFHEITEDAIKEAFEHGRSINENLVDAQTARRVLDRLVGYKLSPLLWQKVRRGLSAGRVQSIALRLIVEREVEIGKFKKETYFTIVAKVSRGQIAVVFDLMEIDGKKIESQETFDLYDGEYKTSKTSITSEAQAKEIITALSHKELIITDVAQKETRRSPQAPYTTSTLQQDASRRLGFAGKRTMSLAQKLYEEGYITYHRTDSVVLADSAIKAMRAYAQKEYGDKYVPAAPRTYTTKQKLAQEAHEAIRPTKVSVAPSAISSQLGNDYGKLYDMIWKRAVASQMSDAITESTTVLADAKSNVILSDSEGSHHNEGDSSPAKRAQNDKGTYTFKANGSVLVFDGFLKANPAGLQDNRLPDFKTGEKIKADEVSDEPHETPAPPRYNDASLIKTLEEKGIGRPSTYAAIIGTIIDRRYVEKLEGRFTPTAIGIAVNEFLVEHFGGIDDIPFTAQMEDDLDEIAHGRKKWVPIMKAFYTPFAKTLESVKGAERVKIEVEESDEKCEKCGKAMVVRTGRFGKFLSCSTFPECDFKKSLVLETGVMCPTDNGKILQRKTHKGRIFFSCENYPNCKYAVWKLEDVGKPAQSSKRKTQSSQISKTALGVKKIVRRKKK